MVGNDGSYGSAVVSAAFSVLLELVRLLEQYQHDVYVVGGWVPLLLLPESPVPHVGSTDVDLALNHLTLQEIGYRTIRELLLGKGYIQDKQPYMFSRKVLVDGQEISVRVDLLAGQYGGTGKSHRHQRILDIHPRKVRGSDLVFENYTEVNIEGELPGGGKASSLIRVASIVPFLVMKGMALHRLKEKDAYDIYYCLMYYPGGLDALGEEFLAHIDNGLVREGLHKIAAAFASEKHIGPKHVADFEQVSDHLERDRIQRDAFERVYYLLRKLAIVN